VSSLNSYFESDFNTQRDQWESALLSELKLTEIGNKASRKLLDGSTWPTLSLTSKAQVQLPSTSWKKAANTYGQIHFDFLNEDVKAGVKNFFFFGEFLNEKKWLEIEEILSKESDIEVFILGGKFESKKFKAVSDIISGKSVHDEGGHAVHELAVMAKNLIENLNQPGDIHLGVYVDSHFFNNIAKIRTAKLLAEKILLESKSQKKYKIVALTSFTGWTLYERYSNMLRNETAVASSFIAGADHIQSSGYNIIHELETENYSQDEHFERSLRMARNTSHVLALESMLGVVEDAAFGSFHLESLTQNLCEE
jgi:hypothetical protein